LASSGCFDGCCGVWLILPAVVILRIAPAFGPLHAHAEWLAGFHAQIRDLARHLDVAEMHTVVDCGEHG
jgi:hypothetical protein